MYHSGRSYPMICDFMGYETLQSSVLLRALDLLSGAVVAVRLDELNACGMLQGSDDLE